MSTVPGHDAWRDAGLEKVDDTTSLLEEVTKPEQTPDHESEADEYRPRTPRPDLEGDANEADVVEQSRAVPEAEDELGDADYA
jgi:hypothetical protein